MSDAERRPGTRPMPGAGLEYVGFWLRVLAALVDTLWVSALVALLLAAVFGRHYPIALLDYLEAGWQVVLSGGQGSLPQPPANAAADDLISYLVPAVLVIAFWKGRGATPGKMLIGASVVDAQSGGPPGLGRLVVRYLGYFVSIMPFMLGLLWVAFDPRKQGWHDKLARTVVVRPARGAGVPP